MRSDPAGSQLTQRNREPRIVVGIIYPTGSIYLTNRKAYRKIPIVNPGFEAGSLTGWNDHGPATIAAADDARSGSYSMKATATGQIGNPNVTIASTQNYAVREGEQILARCHVKRDESGLPDRPAAISLQYLNGDGTTNSFSTQAAASISTSDRQQLQTPLSTVPAGAVNVRILCFYAASSLSTNGSWYYDDFRLERFTGIANVPGNVIHGVMTDISSTSQELQPDEARTTIGRMSFTALDLDGAITQEIREQLGDVDPAGINLREVRVYTGDTDDFADGTWRQVETYVIDSAVELDGRSYRFQCSDRSREQRTDIFEQKKTRLNGVLSDTATTVTVLDTSEFETVAHTASFTDAPSATVGYIRVKKSGEIIRYTGKTVTTFTGCTRGVFGTTAQAVTDVSDTDDKKPEVEEFIYVEMPGPEMVYAIYTGVIKSTGATLPDHWHMGIAEAHVNGDLFDSIGADLYDPADVTKGLVFRFTHRKKTDGKKFVEEQLHYPMGTYAPISSEGVIGIRRMVSLISAARPDAILFPNNIISHGAARHNQARVINQAVVQWNFDGERFTRTDILINSASIAAHGKSKPREIKLEGLHVSRHDRRVLQNIFATITDRYGAPPIELDDVKLSRSMNRLEIGDTARAVLDRILDYTAPAYLDRTFEIQGRRINWRTGDLHGKLFGSTARTLPNAPDASVVTPPLADAFYTATGTNLASVLTISGGAVTANGTLTGGSDLRTSVFYYDGDLTINSDVTITIKQNVQLRVKGTLTINAKIDGAGQGLAGLADPNTVDVGIVAYPASQQASFIGTTLGSAGIRRIPVGGGVLSVYFVVPAPTLRGVNAAAPRLNLTVDGSGNLLGIPAELRGTPGAYGGPVVEGLNGSVSPVRALGGTGGNGGAGLMIISRGLAFGAAGEIDLSGADGSAPASSVTLGGVELYGGAGAGGAPGALYVIADGNTVTRPDLTTAFVASQGSSPQTGNPVPEGGTTHPTSPATGTYAGLPVVDYWEASHFIQYVPQELVTGDSDDEVVPAPTGLAAAGDGAGVLITWVLPPADRYDYVELYESIDNDRANAVRIYKGRANSFFQGSDTSVTRYYWIRAVDEDLGVSGWGPESATGGVSATFGGAVGPPGSDGADGANGADGADGITALPASFAPGRVGGSSDFVYTLNATFNGSPNPAELRIQGGRFDHPDGTPRALSPTPCEIFTGYGESVAGRFFVMWSDADTEVRFGFSAAALGVGRQLIGVVYEPGNGWRAFDNSHNKVTFTPLATDCLIAVVEADSVSSGLSRIVPLTAGVAGQNAISVGVTASNGVAFRQAPDGGAWSPAGTTTDLTFTFRQAGATIATRVVRVTRSNATLTGALQSSSGDATTQTLIGSGTGVLTIIVTHTDSNVSGAQSVTAVQGGSQGSPGANGANGADGADGTDGADGEDFWTPVLSAGMTRTGKTFSKVSGAAWSASFYSSELYGACSAQWQPAQSNAGFMIGLNADPTTNHSYTSLDYAIYCRADGTFHIWESNADRGSFGSYVAGDVFAVTYDGNHVRYLKNGAVLRTIADTGKKFAIDSSFSETGGAANNVSFVATSPGKIDLTTQIFNQLTAAFADAGLVNTSISVAANGALVGAGGGAPVLSSISGSVTIGQLTANVLAALQAVIGNLSAIKAELGTVEISTSGWIRCGAADYDGDGGWWLGIHAGEAAFSMRIGTSYIRMKPSIGIETSFKETGAFTGTLTDNAGNAATVQCLYEKSFNLVTLVINTQGVGDRNISSSNNQMHLTGLPASITPSIEQKVFAASAVRSTLVNVGASPLACALKVTTTGVLEFYPMQALSGSSYYVAESVFPSGAQTKGVKEKVAITYRV